ncbi:Gluconate transport-inducing protein [Ophidiomyces ophidiicola]|uniref:Gluconate transport-inducing protein n=1 Tax=Ophidiomyces ophidiicola TaxID=1387563 RepID=UPI0020C54CC2|nr:Gluconate transport-inducing protein [Ophidiomyces ophidiicola]KAI1942157.1 Gluconate transport-inducing protein [Ophidiomyces ophidiicola]KAI2062302.1 Gluconate transport-inducing protein [Ophidiomyces ophidiicola]KAI2091729.1 Gluconate transport-inducing protein [Ophidiomyces ophidiicola]
METYHGHVRTPADAIILFEACRIGLLPRVQRRLSEKERQSIKSGSVFVWDEREAGMRRWTDGKSWSASRVSGSFLTYREMEGKRGGHSSRAGKTPESNRGSDEDQGEGEEGPDGYRYKPDGLMKQSFSITTSTGQHLHLISYYARTHPTAPGLCQPSTDPQLRQIRPQKGLYPESSVNDQQNLPVVTRSPMGGGIAVPPPIAFPRPTPHSYSPSPYGWPHPPILGPTPVSMIPYVSNYLPPLAANGSTPYPYGPPAYHHPPGYPSPYDRLLHPADQASISAHMHANAAQIAGHAVPYYAQGLSPVVTHHDLVNPHARHAHPATPPAENDARQGDLKADYGQDIRSSSQTTRSPLRPVEASSPASSVRNQSDTATSANVVPSINALVNSDEAPTMTSSISTTSSEHSKASTKQPSNGKVEGPKDIPSDKIGFGEDMRALRQLDRVFSA